MGPALGALTAAITWSDAVLRYVAGSFEAVASWDGIIENPAVPGQLTLVAVSTNGVADDVVTVARFRLRANAAGSTTVMPVATELGTIDSDGVSYDLLQLGNVTFAGSDVVSN
ncbi:MAG: hypothetical protein GTN78_00695 [Gemmatimonadales bacterium]|nr:hypothetical protein [Gemmatimonadales bacterium]NIN10059.1 hypothetical protein [Gemmatimonadales bacterium]NIQ98710.1 hypothetical protein [Gemmatimonadales bacterium]NIS63588.1 hypothetical protein [Gemmatimonadales bacterium]